ncbi:MAG: ATP-binding cassette domain-containing protein, partial [Actinobacteria bacterium]|nr:ATP-binding cassette domain-containing protein [Actinomycetota bacterium]
LFALTSQGLLIVYRGSGVLNFAHGAFGMAAAFVAWDFNKHHGVPYLLSALIGVVFAALLGAVTHLLIMRNLRRASPLARTVATLGVLITVQSAAVLKYGTDTNIVPSWLPTKLVHVGGSVSVTADRLILLALAIVLAIVLWTIYKFTKFGIATTAAAENQRAASSVGLSPDVIATANWALGSALGGLAAIFMTPILQLQVTTMTNMLLAALAVALIANFVSFPVSLAAGLGVGILQTELTRYVSTAGIAQSVPFGVIVLVMVVRGRGLPLRDFFLQRLPSVGTGRLRPQFILLGIVVISVIVLTTPVVWQDAVATSFGLALVLLSVVVLTGYAGQISLGQYALAGTGAYIAGRLSASAHWPFPLVFLVGILGAVPIGLIFALPAVRTRGVNLAIVTLGLGTAIELIVFNSGPLTGGFAGTVTKVPNLFGFTIDPIAHTERYAFFAFGVFVVLAILVANLRRGRSGRRMLAVRTNERAAAALGVNVVTTKLYAFGVSAAIAAAGGIVIAFHSPSIIFSQFDSFSSISILAWTVIGGIGYVYGAVFGAFFGPGSLGAQAGASWLDSIVKYIPLIGGVSLIFVVLQNQDGAVGKTIEQLKGTWATITRSKNKPTPVPPRLPVTAVDRVAPTTMSISGLTVAYGTVIAASDVSFTIRPGAVLGLIGPNGAGKTTVIDAVTGFTPMTTGKVVLEGRDISRFGVTRRSRLGVSRSFQSLELFEDMTVIDNLRTAADPHDAVSYLRDLVYPKNPALSNEVVTAIREFGLEDLLDRVVENLPYGQRRLLAIARAVATKPSVLLLDEPAAGLGDREGAELARLVRRLADDWGIAVLLVEHDMNFVMNVCDEIAVLDFGKMIALGSPEEIRSNPDVIAAYLGDEDTAAAEAAASHIHGDTVEANQS